MCTNVKYKNKHCFIVMWRVRVIVLSVKVFTLKIKLTFLTLYKIRRCSRFLLYSLLYLLHMWSCRHYLVRKYNNTLLFSLLSHLKTAVLLSPLAATNKLLNTGKAAGETVLISCFFFIVSFCLKGDGLDGNCPAVIDYTPYLKFTQRYMRPKQNLVSSPPKNKQLIMEANYTL